MNSPPFSKVCAGISAELIAVENEQRLIRLADPRYRAFLAELFRMSLTADHDPALAIPSKRARKEERHVQARNYADRENR
jgi:hypothetical protein